MSLYASGKLLRETYGSNTLDFFYDQNGYPYALKYNGTLYYYITNLQGDVLHLTNSSGTAVASYTYDPYGKPLTTTGTLASTVGAANPLRYRGYYYDTETGFYYLQSRYYDPTICRFINADSYASTGQGIIGNNMFAYCGNNAVSNHDSTGDDYGTATPSKQIFRSEVTHTYNGTRSRGWHYIQLQRSLASDSTTWYEDIWIFVTNTDEAVVLEAEHFAFYKGALVIKVNNSLGSASFGIIFLNTAGTNNERGVNTLNHEYGHFLHFWDIGPSDYLLKVAIPSLAGAVLQQGGMLDMNYYDLPWERIADILGGVDRGGYASRSTEAAFWYWLYTKFS